MSTFKIGDRVQHSSRGKGYVINTYNSETYLIEYDKNIGGHDGKLPFSKVEGKDEHCWWEEVDHLKLIRETSSTTTKIDKHKEICNTLHEIYKAKNHDYGDSFGKSYKKYGLTSAMVRLSDKFNRLESISQKENKVEDETLEDTLIDLANYCIMTLIELEEED